MTTDPTPAPTAHFHDGTLRTLIGEIFEGTYGMTPEEVAAAVAAADNLTVISDELSGHSRWDVWHELRFTDGERHYRTKYAVGATEMQDTEPWWHIVDDDGMVAVEVYEPEPDPADRIAELEALLRDVLNEPHPETGEPQLGVNTRHRIRVALGEAGR